MKSAHSFYMNMILITNSLYDYDTQSMLFGLAKPYY